MYLRLKTSLLWIIYVNILSHKFTINLHHRDILQIDAQHPRLIQQAYIYIDVRSRRDMRFDFLNLED